MNTVHRKIRSFVRREGRLTPAQRRALEELWPRFGVDKSNQTLDFPAIFGNRGPVTLEIGFGNGESLAKMAAAMPEQNFIGIEVHRPGVGNLLLRCEELALDNVRIMRDDAVEILHSMIPDQSLDTVQIFFPDPWHKKRHHKRRLLQDSFMTLLARKQADSATMHFATDWQDYAEYVLELMADNPDYRQTTKQTEYHHRPANRPETKFERRGRKLGHKIWDILYRREY